jgi:hypothetical protein
MRQQQARKTKPKPIPREDPFLEWLAWLMDESVRIGPWSIGLDGFLGLIPGFGDLTGAIVSSFIVSRALQSGISRGAVLRMVLNVGIDSLLGAIPFIGDLFDFAFKSNVRNLQIYREALRGDRVPVKDWSFVILVISIMLTMIAVPLMTMVYVVKMLFFR